MSYRKPHKQLGFTLMELMITVAVIGIIAAIAIPSYSEYVIRAKRADAKVALLEIAQKQESFFVQNMSYAAGLLSSNAPLGNLGYSGTSVQSENDLYTISIVQVLDSNNGACDGTSNDACRSYVLEASPIIGASQARDKKCTGFRIDSVGRKFAKGGTVTSFPATPTADSIAKTKECWGK